MSKVVVDMSMSLDGFIAGPNAAPENPLGDGGLRLHEWISKDPDVAKVVEGDTGAIIMGRRTYDESVPWWHGSGPLGDVPCFVLTDKGTEPGEAASMFTFITDGAESALEQAKQVAGGKDIGVGGAKTIQQYLNAGLIDEVRINLVPLLLGGGTSLFDKLGQTIDLEKINAKDGIGVTRLTYRVKK